MDTIGGILATLTIPTDTGGFQQLLDWATSFARQRRPGHHAGWTAAGRRRRSHWWWLSDCRPGPRGCG
ncbi:hypothetical protein [Streptomyces mirabilis]|uniref:hypothetical protein n=1 Tax=Streptomyces mirabilis TaxID=68239 RepID=UPI0036ACE0CF